MHFPQGHRGLEEEALWMDEKEDATHTPGQDFIQLAGILQGSATLQGSAGKLAMLNFEVKV